MSTEHRVNGCSFVWPVSSSSPSYSIPRSPSICTVLYGYQAFRKFCLKVEYSTLSTRMGFIIETNSPHQDHPSRKVTSSLFYNWRNSGSGPLSRLIAQDQRKKFNVSNLTASFSLNHLESDWNKDLNLDFSASKT